MQRPCCTSHDAVLVLIPHLTLCARIQTLLMCKPIGHLLAIFSHPPPYRTSFACLWLCHGGDTYYKNDKYSVHTKI
jgi:hypothetical protein